MACAARGARLYIGYEVPITHYRAVGDVTVFRFFLPWFDLLLGCIEFGSVRNVGGCGSWTQDRELLTCLET